MKTSLVWPAVTMMLLMAAGCTTPRTERSAGGDESMDSVAGVWREESHFFVALPQASNMAVASQVASALAALQFKEDDQASMRHPVSLLTDLIATYEAETYASASVFRATGRQCFYISVENYSEEHAGLSTQARKAVERNLRAAFGDSIEFFSDTNCKDAV